MAKKLVGLIENRIREYREKGSHHEIESDCFFLSIRPSPRNTGHGVGV
jgi:hypothetical protein